MRKESDPNGLSPHDIGAKLDNDKEKAGLLNQFSLSLTEIAKVLTYGTTKYSVGGWLHVESGFDRYSDAMIRHWLKEKINPIDEDSGLMHVSQVAWNALARLEILLRDQK